MLGKIALGLALAIAPLLASAQEALAIAAPASGSAYLQDSRGIVVRSGHNLCWHTGYWTPADALQGCDGALVPPVVINPAAPPIVQPPVAQVEAPAVPAPPRRCDASVTLKSDETFGFNRDTLTAAARARLDADVLAHLSGCAEIERITVTGHSDHLGAARYNQRLSERRARRVASYLMEKGVPAERVVPQGAGESTPVQACDVKLPRAQMIACLAPNRRVEVEIRGTAR